jgi:hypothetical protein
MKLTALCLILRLRRNSLRNSGPTVQYFGHTAEVTPYHGDHMEPNEKDVFIEEIDNDLRAIDARLKEVLSKTDLLLEESRNETRETEKIQNHDGSRPS